MAIITVCGWCTGIFGFVGRLLSCIAARCPGLSACLDQCITVLAGQPQQQRVGVAAPSTGSTWQRGAGRLNIPLDDRATQASIAPPRPDPSPFSRRSGEAPAVGTADSAFDPPPPPAQATVALHEDA